jgi:hypothetical protein
MVPKNFKTNININPSKIGFERRKEIFDGITDKNTYLPRGVNQEDMDESFIEFVTNDLKMSFDGAVVPVLFMTIQRWTEYTKTWEFTDEYKDIQLPFISIVRKPDIQVGTNQAGLYNIPGRPTYTYLKVPTWDGIREGIDLYKIPQPTAIDITYEVRVFTTRMKDLNVFNSKVHRKFNAIQSYINVKGHPMPVVIESISDESNIEDFENRRFYVQHYEMLLKGYLLDEEDYVVVPTANRAVLFTEISTNKPIFRHNASGDNVTFTYLFKPMAAMVLTFTSTYSVMVRQLINIQNLTNINISVNGSVVFNGLSLINPFQINLNDVVTITVSNSTSLTGSFNLIGYLQ